MTQSRRHNNSHPLSDYWRKIHLLLAAALILICPVTLASLPLKMNFQSVLEGQDLVLGEIGHIFQDSQGFIWIGGATTLVRFDGYEFRVMEYSDDDAEKTITSIWQIFEDSQGIIWVGTRLGISRYDAAQDKFTQIKNKAGSPDIDGAYIRDFVELSDGKIVAASSIGLIILDRKTFDYSIISEASASPGKLHGNVVNDLYLENEEILWAGTDAGLERFNLKTGQITLIKPYPSHPELVDENIVMHIEPDGEGKFWVGTSKGLILLNPETLEYRRFEHDPNDPTSLSDDEVWEIMIDSQGIVWIATDGGGLVGYDKNTDLFQSYKYKSGSRVSISSDVVRTVIEDRNGDLWVGNYPEGVNFFDRSSAGITSYTAEGGESNSLSHKSILSIQEDAEQNLWIGTDGGGLNKFDRKYGRFSYFRADPEDPNALLSDAVITVYIDSTGRLWAGGWAGGVVFLNDDGKTFTRLPHETPTVESATKKSYKLNSPHVWSIREDRQNNLWIGTHTGGLSRYDRETKEFTHYWSDDGTESPILGNLVWTTFEDSRGNFWVGTASGLELMDRETGHFTHYLPDQDDPTAISGASTISFHEDSKGRLWIGTEGGLNQYHYETNTFTYIQEKDGLNDNTIRKILEDESGVLWLSTNNGVSSYDPETKKIKNYNRDSGTLIGVFNYDSGIVSQRGEIIFGGVNGLRIFNPQKLKENDTVPPIVLTDFKIFADSVPVNGPDGILSQEINHTDVIELDYTKSMFVIDFSALNFRDSEKNQYAYKLEGFDDNWLNVGNQRSAKYTNLNAGRYNFTVKGSNNDGVWNEEGRTITIVQLPPPWKTWWAYTLYVIIVISAIAWAIQVQRRKRQIVEEQNRILEERVAERTAELRQKNDDIQAMLENMRQGLFTVEANGQIHPEYSLHLETIFNTQNIAGRNVFDLLFTGAKIGGDILDQVRAAVAAIIGEDEMNYEFNACLLIDEYAIEIENDTKILNLDWNPIVVDDEVIKLMVSVRDVTLLKQMESEAAHQKRELEIISQLLNVTSKKYLSFEESARKFIAENREKLKQTPVRDDDVIALLFRNMHTIKGNCRTFGFSQLSDIVHDAESTYSEIKASTEAAWSVEALLGDLDTVEAGLEEYADIYHRVLKRDDSPEKNDREDGIWLPRPIVNKIQDYANEKRSDDIIGVLDSIQASPISVVIGDIIQSLSSIATQLDKEVPVVDINAPNILIRQCGHELFNNIFTHLLRNCVDHGIETTEMRAEKQKPLQGHITINALDCVNLLNIYIKDDGRGLDIEGLFQKGVEMKRWEQDDQPSLWDIAQFMFTTNVSTKKVVTDISGRGVGMDAVKQFLKDAGGDINLILPNVSEGNRTFVPFELVITLPSQFYCLEHKD